VIDKLEFILALAREKHFGRAAEAGKMTQPTLSAGVRRLGTQMGVLLVHRGSRFQGFTPEGQRVLEWARRIIGDTRTMREEVSALRHGLVGRLRIAGIPNALAMVASLTTPYRAKYPMCSSPSGRALRWKSPPSRTSRSKPGWPTSTTTRSGVSIR
jgi:DNA-binding transcriptional LysR family regulator